MRRMDVNIGEICRVIKAVDASIVARAEHIRLELLGGQPASIVDNIRKMIGAVRGLGLRCDPAKGLLFAQMLKDGRITCFDLGRHYFCTRGIGMCGVFRRRIKHRGFRCVCHIRAGSITELGRQLGAHLRHMVEQAEITENGYEDLDAVRMHLGFGL